MPFRQTPQTFTPYGIIAFDKNGVERNDDPDGIGGLFSARVLTAMQASQPTDIFLFSHGWKGDMPSAIDQYNRWIDAMAGLAADANRMGPDFKPLWIGLHWPSQPWGEEELAGPSTAFDVQPAASTSLIDAYLDRLDPQDVFRARQLLGIIFRENRLNPAASMLPLSVANAYRELAAMLNYSAHGPGADPGSDNAPYDPQAAFVAMNSASVAFGGGFLGGLLGPLRQLSFWIMKKRARTVGESGMARFVANLQTTAPTARIHLMGHSFGTIVVSSICAGANGNSSLPRPVDSLVLVQGAVSLWSYADAIPSTGDRGYFNPMYHRNAVRGPIVTTRSRHDIACGVWYPAAVSLLLQSPSFGDAVNLIVWGAIGSFGIQGIAGAVDQPMLPETGDYHFENKIYNLDANDYIKKMDGAGGAHSDIDGPQVAHAIWQAALVSAQAASGQQPAPSATAATAGAGQAGSGSSSSPAAAPTQAAAPASAMTPPVAPAVITTPAPVTSNDMPVPFGVEAGSGKYLPQIQPSDLDHIGLDPNLVRTRAANAGMSHLGVSVETNADDLSQAGWGVIFPRTMPQKDRDAIKSALKPLLDKRRQEAGDDRFFVFEGENGYDPDQDKHPATGEPSAETWLNRHGAGNAVVVDPAQGVPYYVLLIGSPDQIPFNFQYELDILYAVGRLYFETPDEYAQYARNIVGFETSTDPGSRDIVIFNTRNEGDYATSLLHDTVALPLASGVGPQKPLGATIGFNVNPILADAAVKPALLGLFANGVNGRAPALIFSGSHGVSFPVNADQRFKQGALLTQEWVAGFGATPDTYVVADEIPEGGKLNGAIHFLFACYGAGCPQFDTYTYLNGQPRQIANSTIVARLPQKLLLSGVQAVVGHIDRAWAYSFQNAVGATMTQNFRDPLMRILATRRVGDALDIFDQHWTALSQDLFNWTNKRNASPGTTYDAQVANRWTARDDARNYVVLGDPAVRIKKPAAVTAAPSAAAEAIVVNTAAPAPAPAPSPAPASSAAFAAAAADFGARPKLSFKDFSGRFAIKTAVSPDCGFQLVEPVLASAKSGSKVDVYIYSMSAPYLLNLFKGAVDRGAKVRAMYDPVQMPKSSVAAIRQMGVDIRVAPTGAPRNVFTVCHQKFVVVDSRTVLVESANWAASSIPERPAGGARKKGNREWLIRVDDPAVASWYAALFQADWDIPAQASFAAAAEVAVEPEAPSFRAPSAAPPRDFTPMNFASQQATITPLTSPDNYFDQVLPLIRSAQRRIWIQQQYIEAGGATTIPRLLEAIKQKSSKVDVRLMVSSKFSSGWTASKETIADAGLSASLRAINLDNFTHLHNKGVIVDDAVVVASTNWSENSVRFAREAGILIHSPEVTDYYAQVFSDDWRTGWSVATADSRGSSFDVTVVSADDVDVDPADRLR